MASSSLKIILETIKKGSGEKDVKKGLDGIVGSLLTVGTASAAFGVLVSFTKQAVAAAAEAERAEAQVEAVLKSTGEAAGMTMQDIKGYSGTLQELSGVEDDYFMKMSAVMLTFTRVTKDTFLEATTAALDMSTALGTDMQQSVIMVGKALNVAAGDVQGASTAMSAMKRVGVAFTTDQIDMAKKLIETGDALGYQKLILGELNTEFGGSAAAQLDTYAGRVVALKSAWGNYIETIGNTIISSENTTGVMKILTEGITAQTERIALLNSAREAGIDITTRNNGLIIYSNGIRITEEELIQKTAEAEAIRADAAGKAAYAQGELNDTTLDSIDILGNYKSLVSGSAQSLYEVGIAAMEAELSLDGSFSAEDAQKVLDYKYNLGLVTDEEYRVRDAAIKMQAAIDALHDKGITITTTWIDAYMMQQNDVAARTRKDATQQNRAGGGPLADITKVGEQGFEYIVNGMVIPHEASVWLERAGIFAQKQRALGGKLAMLDGERYVTPTYYSAVVTSTKAANETAAASKYATATSVLSNPIAEKMTETTTQSVVEAVAPVLSSAVMQFQQVAQDSARSSEAQTAAIIQSNAELVDLTREMLSYIRDQPQTFAQAVRTQDQSGWGG